MVVLWTEIGFPGRLEKETTTHTSASYYVAVACV